MCCPAPELPFTDPVEQGGLHQVLAHARNTYEWTVVDLPSIFQRLSLLTLSEADRAFIVATSELASLHLATEGGEAGHATRLGFAESSGAHQPDGQAEHELNTSDLTKLFECHVDTSLPNDQLALAARSDTRAASGKPTRNWAGPSTVLPEN